MPVKIGAEAEHGFDKPIALMKDCHRRIEGFLGVFQTLAALPPGAKLDTGHQESLRKAVHYFESASPRHVADEEQSLFARMRQYPQCDDVLRELERLEDEHCRAQSLHATCHTIGQFWLELGSLPDRQREKFAVVVNDLAALYKTHIELEESRVFPLAESLLSVSEKEEIGQEMADRRGLFATA